MGREISSDRKAAFYLGTVLMVIGGVLFASVFLSLIASDFGRGPARGPVRIIEPSTGVPIQVFGQDPFSAKRSQTASMVSRAIFGVVLLLVGTFVRRVGQVGLAGAGIVLDPDAARQDLEPFSRMAGGMVKDALDEAGIDARGRAARVVMIKCLECGHLNEEDSRFCQECGSRF